MGKYYFIKARLLSFVTTFLAPVSVHNFQKFNMIQDIWANIEMDSIKGDYLEFGILRGKSLLHSFNCAKKLQITNCNFYGFDSFEGFPIENHDFFTKNNFVTNYEKVKNTFSNFKNVHILKGFFEETLKHNDIKKIDKISFAFIDCDIYESAISILPFIKERISAGGFIMIDDFSSIDKNGNSIYKAFIEYFDIGQDCILYDTYSNGQIYRVI